MNFLTLPNTLLKFCFVDIQRIDGQELINEVSSPHGQYTNAAYLNNGGATTAYAILFSAKNNQTKIEWKDEHTVMISGMELDVNKDTYDFRND